MGRDGTGEDLVPVQYQRLFGNRTGIIRKVLTRLPERSGPAVSTTEPLMTDHTRIPGHGYEPSINASGKGDSLSESLLLTVGEAIERYCVRFPPQDEFDRATYADLQGRADADVVDFEYLDIFDVPPDAPLDPPSRDTTLDWAVGTNLLDGTETYVPAELVWFMNASGDADRHFTSTSNAVAAGKSPEMALTNALLEAVERDALIWTWLYQRRPQRVDLSRFPEVRERVTEAFDHDFLDVHLSKLDGRVDLPVVGATVVDQRDRYPKFAIAGNADFTWTDALTGAVFEAAQCYTYLRSLVKDDEDLSLDQTITNFTDNAYLYGDPELYDEVEFLTGAPDDDAVVPDDDEPTLDWSEKLQRCLSAVEDAGFTPIAFDLTTPDARDVGIDVVRVFVPELLPLPFPSVPPTDHPAVDESAITTRPHPIP
ncbi:hypothetical protein BRC81_05225 [Halobacteriales archaeon QS_1_68_20]|nr:MAG: hypothetical protein BRC81_05225 [Halobacteriales archaeon QS_1_68_20]